MLAGLARHPDAAIGLTGYRLGPPPYRHANFEYHDTVATGAGGDADVDVLGGMFGVAYRAAYFDLERLLDYSGAPAAGAVADAPPPPRWPGGAFFVDDDWISATLADAGVRRVVIGGAAAAAPGARTLSQGQVLVKSLAFTTPLNTPEHAFINERFQEVRRGERASSYVTGSC